jgi:hypothetical protein
MLTARYPAESGPLTHIHCLAALNRAAIDGAFAGRLWVQARRFNRDGPYWLCGQLLGLGHSDAEWFKVETAIETFWAHGRNLRLCSGDDECDSEPTLVLRRTDDSTDSATAVEAQQPCGLQRGCDFQPNGYPA